MASSILNSDDGVISGTSGLKSSGGDDGALAVQSNGTEVAKFKTTELVINDGGANYDFRVEGDTDANLLVADASADRVGIGTTSPTSKLDINGGSAATTLTVQTSGALYSANIDLKSSSTTTIKNDNGVVSISNGDAAGQLRYNMGGTERARFTPQGYFKASDNATYDGTTSTYHEFDNSVNASCLKVISRSTSQVAEIFDVQAYRNTTDNTFYVIRYYNSPGAAIRFLVADSGNVTNTNNSYGSISDVKLKQDIVDAGSQWGDIKNLRVRKYHWKSDPDGFMQMGLIAQEAELVSPGLIEEHSDYEEIEVPVLDDDGNPVLNEDGTPQVTKERNALGTTTKAVKYSVLYMKAVKALQEAMERIETLEAKVAALEAVPGNE